MVSLQEQVVQKVNRLSEDNLQFLLEMIERFMQADLVEEKTGLLSDQDSGMLDYRNLKNGDERTITPKMKAFLELEEMLVPLPEELDYDKELAEARQEKYEYTG